MDQSIERTCTEAINSRERRNHCLLCQTAMPLWLQPPLPFQAHAKIPQPTQTLIAIAQNVLA
jgi:hypothetical protein